MARSTPVRYYREIACGSLWPERKTAYARVNPGKKMCHLWPQTGLAKYTVGLRRVARGAHLGRSGTTNPRDHLSRLRRIRCRSWDCAEAWEIRPVRWRRWSICEDHSLGYRDVEHTREKPPGVFRIAVLGDSMTEARQVSIADTFCKQLEKRLSGGRNSGISR